MQTNGGAQLPRLKPLKVLPPASGAANTGAAGSAAWLGSPCTPELEQVLQQHHLSAEFERQARAMKEATSAAVAAKASHQKLDAEVPNVDGMDASRGTQTGSSPGSSRKRGSQNLQAAVPAAANAGPDEQTAGSISAPKRSRSSTPAQPLLRAAAPTPCPPKTCLLPRPASQPQLVQQGRPLTPHLGSLALESVPGPAAMACAGPPAAAAWTAPPPGAAVLSPTPTPDMDAFLKLMMQKRVLQQQLSHLQQQIAGTSQAHTAMVYAARPPAAALTPAATEQAQQAQTCLDKTGNEQHHERAAALAASLLLAKQQQQKQHQLLQRAFVEQLQQQQQQQRQDVRLYQPRPQLGASPVPPPPAPPPTAPPAMPAWQQLKVECQQQLRQLAAEEQAEDEEEERGELRSSASSSSPVHQLSQRTIRAERALNAVASLVLCPLSRVSTS